MKIDNLNPNPLTQDLINDIEIALSILAKSPLPEESTVLVQQALQKLDILSNQMFTNQKKLLDELHLVQQEKNKFVSVVTHELRLPMTSIKGYTDLLRQGVVGPVNEQQLGFLDTIRNNVDRMSALLSDLSDLSRIDTGGMKLEIAPIELQDALDSVLQNLQPLWKIKEQTVKVELSNQLPKISADFNRLVQVITYLLHNAIMYTPVGGTIIIRAFSELGQLRFEVVDNGIGIKPEDQANIFSPFFRSDDVNVRDQFGWGLSLNVTTKLIQIMNGSIGVYSELGAGSTFWFTLPLHTGS